MRGKDSEWTYTCFKRCPVGSGCKHRTAFVSWTVLKTLCPYEQEGVMSPTETMTLVQYEEAIATILIQPAGIHKEHALLVLRSKLQGYRDAEAALLPLLKKLYAIGDRVDSYNITDENIDDLRKVEELLKELPDA